jgi:hypothetical protein
MTLLSGIIARPGVSRVLTTITSYQTSSTSSSGMTLTGGSAGNIYILVHSVIKASGSSVSFTSPTSFTAGNTRSNASERVAYRISYRYLTSTVSTISVPSVTNAQAQVAMGFVINDVNRAYTSLSNPLNQVEHVFGGGDPSFFSQSVIFNDIAIGSHFQLNSSGAAFNGDLVVTPALTGSLQVTSSGTQETLFHNSYLKLYNAFDNDNSSFDAYPSPDQAIAALNVIRPVL